MNPRVGIFLSLWAVVIFCSLPAVSRAAVVINEIDPDQASATDQFEFIELYGDPLTSLSGYAVVLWNGANDLSYNAFDLDGYTIGASGHFLLGTASVSPAVDIVFPNNTLQNGADAVALYLASASDFPNGTPLTSTNLVDAIVYGGSGHPVDAGLLAGLGQSTQYNEGALGDADTVSIGRSPDGSGSFGLGTPTPMNSGIPQVPEPASCVLLAGAAALGGAGRRRRFSAAR